MNGLVTCVDMNVLPLGSYDFLIGMDWLEANRVKLDFYNKTFECLDEGGNLRVVRGIPKVISVRNISAMQLKKTYRKGCECMQPMLWRKHRRKLKGWNIFMCCRNSGTFFLMRF